MNLKKEESDFNFQLRVIKHFLKSKRGNILKSLKLNFEDYKESE